MPPWSRHRWEAPPPEAGGGGPDGGGPDPDAEHGRTPLELARAWNLEADRRIEAGDKDSGQEAAGRAAGFVRREVLRSRFRRELTPPLLDEGCRALSLSAGLWLEAGDPKRAAAAAGEAVGWARDWLAAQARSPARTALSTALNLAVDSRSRLGQTPIDLSNEAVRIAREAVGIDPSTDNGRRLRDALAGAAGLALLTGASADERARALDAAAERLEEADVAAGGLDASASTLRLQRLKGDLEAARGKPGLALALYHAPIGKGPASQAGDNALVLGAELLRREPGNALASEEVRRLHRSIADARRARGELADERDALEAAGAVALPADSPDDRHARLSGGLVRLDRAERDGELPDPDHAEGLLTSAEALWRREGSPRAARRMAECCAAAAGAQMGAGRPEVALRRVADGMGWLDAASEGPGTPAGLETRVRLLTLRGDAAGALGSAAGALGSYHEAWGRLASAPGADPAGVARTVLRRKMAAAAAAAGDEVGAGRHVRVALALAEARWGVRGPEDGPALRRERALCWEALGDLEVRGGDLDGARRSYGRALEDIEARRESPRGARDRARILGRLAAAEVRAAEAGEGTAAEDRLREALGAARALDGAPGRRAEAAVLDELGHLALARSEPGKGLLSFQAARELRRRLLDEQGANPAARRELARSHRNVGDAHLLLADAAIGVLKGTRARPDAWESGKKARRDAKAACDAALAAFQDAHKLVRQQGKASERLGVPTGAVRVESALLRERQGDVWLRRAELGSIELARRRAEARAVLAVPAGRPAERYPAYERRPVTGPVAQADKQYRRAAELLEGTSGGWIGRLLTAPAGRRRDGSWEGDRGDGVTAHIAILEKRAYLANKAAAATHEAGLVGEADGYLSSAWAHEEKAAELRLLLPEAIRPPVWPPGVPPLGRRRRQDFDLGV